MSKKSWLIYGHPQVWLNILDILSDDEYLAMDNDELLEMAEGHAECMQEAVDGGDVYEALSHMGYLYGCYDLSAKRKYSNKHGWWNIGLTRQLREIVEQATQVLWPSFKKLKGTFRFWYEDHGEKPKW